MNRRLAALALHALLPVAVLAAPASPSGLQSLEHSEQRFVYPDPDIPTLEDVSEPQGTVLERAERRFLRRQWDDLAAGKLEAVRRAIAERMAEIPGWQVPPWLERELARAEVGAKLHAARREPRSMFALYKAYPARFNCREYYHLWDLADAYAALDQAAATTAIHQQVLERCRAPKVLLITLDRIAAGEGLGQALARSESVSGRVPAEELMQRHYAWRSQLAANLRDKGDMAGAVRMLQPVEVEIGRRHDVDVARLHAWNLHNSGESERAEQWFSMVAEWGGEADRLVWLQGLWASGKREVVLAWLAQHPLQAAEARQWAADILRSEATARYREGRYQASLALFEQAQGYAPESTGSTLLRGWAHFQRNEFQSAFATFASAYRQCTDEECRSAIEGLLHSAKRGDEWQALLALADEHTGGLLATPDEKERVAAVRDGRLDASMLAVSDGRLIERAPFEAETFIGAGIGGYTRRGSRGTDRLTAYDLPLLSGQWTAGDLRLYARVANLQLDSGKPVNGTLIGSGEWGVTAPLRNVDFATSGDAEWLLGAQLLASPFYLELGRTAASERYIDTTWMGRLGYSVANSGYGIDGSLYRTPRRDSQLAYLGMSDPFSTTDWGRVMEQGAALDGYRLLSPYWKLAGHLGLFALEGEGVKDNDGTALYLSLLRQLPSAEQDTFELGPYLYYTAYAENLSHFTLGHGGYYSPQSMLQLGIGTSWLRERQRSVVHLEASLGYQSQHEDAVERFPLKPDGNLWQAADSEGISGRLQLSWARQLGDSRWQWDGLLSASEGVAYAERSGWLFLRYKFGKAAPLNQGDLPERWRPVLPRP